MKEWFKWYWTQPKLEYSPKTIPYESLYPLDTLKESIHETIDHLMNKRVEETTPEGVVILSYHEESNTFFYWAQKPIAYRYLEVLARKYVILYDCKDLYVNMNRELLKAVQSLQATVPKPKTDSPFATFRSYNKVHKKPTKIANELGNVYKHVGKELPSKVVETFKPITFADYKKIHMYTK
jgi:hypothetical protein